MATVIFLLKRFFAQRLLALALVVALAFAIGVLVAGPIYADAARDAILSSAIRSAPVTIKNVRFQLYGPSDFPYTAADEKVVSEVGRLPVHEIVPQASATVRLGAGGEPLSVPIFFREGSSEHLSFRGRPPGPGQIAVPASAATASGIRRGDEVTLYGPTGEARRVEVSGIYRPPDRSDPFWFGELSPFPEGTEQPQPRLLDRSTFLEVSRELGLTSQFVWDAYLDFRGLPYEEAVLLPARIQEVADAIRRDPALSTLRTITGLDTLLELVRQRVANLQLPVLLVVIQIGAVALAVLVGVGSLVLTRQSFELAVLRSRGFSGGKLLAGQGVQALITAALAYPLGLVFGLGLASLAARSNGPTLPGVLFPIRMNLVAEALGLVTAVLGGLALVLLSVPHLRRTILEERRLVSREEKPALMRFPVEAVVLPLAFFAYLEVRNGRAVSVFERGDLDPLVLLAPTLLIFGVSFLALRLLLFVLRRLDGPIGRAKGLAPYLAGRRLGRSPGTSVATSLLLVLSVGLLVVSASYRATVMANHRDSAHQQVGADWNVEVAAAEQPLVELARTPAGTTPIVRTEPVFGRPGDFQFAPQLLAVDPATYAEGGWWRADYSDLSESEWLRALRTPSFAVPLAPGAQEITADVEAAPSVAGLDLVATVKDAQGAVTPVTLGRLRAGRGTYSGPVEGATHLLSLTLVQEGIGTVEGRLQLRIDELSAGGEAIALDEWQPIRWRSSDGTVADGKDVEIEPGVGRVVGGISPPMPPVPALVSPAVASSQGEVFEVTIGGERLDLRQVGVAEHFPTVPVDFMAISSPALLEAAARIPEPGLGVGEVWAMGGDPRPALERAGFVVGGAQSAGPIVAYLSQLPQSLAVGMHFTAAAGGLGLVIIGVAIGLYFAQRRREFEFAALRAMGTGSGQITRELSLEQLALVGFSILAGTAIGLAVLTIMMPHIGKSLGAPFPQPLLVVDWPWLLAAFVAIAAATALGLAAAIRALLRASVTSVLRGEAE